MSSDHESAELCVCFHVSRRQIEKHIRLQKPRFASQCSECYGAGTGCGWCIPFIEKMFEQIGSGLDHVTIDLSPEEYRARRKEYLGRVKMDRMKPDEPEPLAGEGLAEALDRDAPE